MSDHRCLHEFGCPECYERLVRFVRERDEALQVRDLAREASNRDLEAKREAEAEAIFARAAHASILPELAKLDAYEDVLREVAMPPYADSDPASLLETLRARAQRVLGADHA